MTVGKKEKLLVTSNFSFFHGVFKRRLMQTRKPGLVWERINEIDLVNLVKEQYILSQTTNFRRFQTERVCRRQL